MRPTFALPAAGRTCIGQLTKHGQVIDVTLSARRVLAAARRFFSRALAVGVRPVEVTTDRAHAYSRVLDEKLPAALHVVELYANNPVEADHSRLKARLRPMRGLQRLQSAQTVCAGHAFIQNLRRSHYEIATGEQTFNRLNVAFASLAAVGSATAAVGHPASDRLTQHRRRKSPARRRTARGRSGPESMPASRRRPRTR